MEDKSVYIDVFLKYPLLSETQKRNVHDSLEKLQDTIQRKIVVLDDDPTGTQTVHDVSVYTSWDKESIRQGFLEENLLFFILTNSRSFSEEKTREVHEEIGKNLVEVSKETGKKFILISRSDSTLRGHYPLETETLKDAIEKYSDEIIDGEILIPFFVEGGRYTIEDIHYMQEGNRLIPVGKTEFARDKTFYYTESDLKKWCEEKTKGKYPASNVESVSLTELRNLKTDLIQKKLEQMSGFSKIIVNAVDYGDIEVFLNAYYRALENGKNFIFRSAASLVKVIGMVESRPLLSASEVIGKENGHGGIVLVGSHVRKTSDQLACLKEGELPLEFIEFNQHTVLERGGLDREVKRVTDLVEERIKSGRTVVVFTRRERIDFPDEDPEKQLEMSVRISEAVTSIIGELPVDPGFIIAKGGITSSDVATKALHIRRATVMGQMEPGIPVWRTGAESKFPGMAYMIFPGNVGKKDTLKRILTRLLDFYR